MLYNPYFFYFKYIKFIFSSVAFKITLFPEEGACKLALPLFMYYQVRSKVFSVESLGWNVTIMISNLCFYFQPIKSEKTLLTRYTYLQIYKIFLFCIVLLIEHMFRRHRKKTAFLSNMLVWRKDMYVSLLKELPWT